MSAMKTALVAALGVLFGCGLVFAVAAPDQLLPLLALISVAAGVVYLVKGVVATIQWLSARFGPRNA